MTRIEALQHSILDLYESCDWIDTDWSDSMITFKDQIDELDLLEVGNFVHQLYHTINEMVRNNQAIEVTRTDACIHPLDAAIGIAAHAIQIKFWDQAQQIKNQFGETDKGQQELLNLIGNLTITARAIIQSSEIGDDYPLAQFVVAYMTLDFNKPTPLAQVAN